MYYKNNRLVSRKEVPEDEMMRLVGIDPSSILSSPVTVDQQNGFGPQLTNDGDVCVMCNTPTSRRKFVNLQSIPVCPDCRGKYTTGEVVEQLNRNTNGRNK